MVRTGPRLVTNLAPMLSRFVRRIPSVRPALRTSLILLHAAAFAFPPGAGAQPYLEPQPQPRSASDPLAEAATLFTDHFFAGEFEAMEPLMADILRNALPPDKAAAVLQGIGIEAGKLLRAGRAMRAHNERGYRVVFRTLEFERATLEARIVFDHEDRIGGFYYKPSARVVDPPDPTYSDPALFDEEEAIVGFGRFALPATLTIPKNPPLPPVVVFVHGSGPNDRDETIGPNKPFRDIAWGLASRGIASLRYDKRTYVHASELSGMTITHREEVVEDALAAVRLAASDPRFDPGRVFLIGHSLGGTLAPLIAAEACEIDGVVMMAATPRPLLDVMYEQMEYLLGLDGLPDQEDAIILDEMRTSMELLRSGRPGVGRLESIPPEYINELEKYDPVATAKLLLAPIRILQGGRDYQVTEAKDFAIWRAELSDRPGVSFKLYPKLDHLFRSGDGKSRPSDYAVPGNPDARFLTDLAAWILNPHAEPEDVTPIPPGEDGLPE